MQTVLILEDEEYTLRFLKQLISEHPQVDKVIGSSSSKEAVRLSQEHLPDLAFLDIELGEGEGWNGIDVAKTINSISPQTKLVFVTGYERYALDAFQVHPYDYVLKPINKDKIMNLITELSRKEKQSVGQELDKLIIKVKNEMLFIDYQEVFFVEKQGKRILIHSMSGVYETNGTLQELEGLLPPQFLKVHKSFIVNLNHINRIIDINRSYQIHFKGCEQVAFMSRKQYEQLRHNFTPSLRRHES